MAGKEIDVQIVNHYDITPYGAPTLFERAELLAERRPGEPHPWVRPVITSYSIHYTKLYECLAQQEAEPLQRKRRDAVARGHGFVGQRLGPVDEFLVIVGSEEETAVFRVFVV